MSCLDQALREAETGSVSYLDFTIQLLQSEALHREQRDAEKRLKTARLPLANDLTQLAVNPNGIVASQ